MLLCCIDNDNIIDPSFIGYSIIGKGHDKRSLEHFLNRIALDPYLSDKIKRNEMIGLILIRLAYF